MDKQNNILSTGSKFDKGQVKNNIKNNYLIHTYYDRHNKRWVQYLWPISKKKYNIDYNMEIETEITYMEIETENICMEIEYPSMEIEDPSMEIENPQMEIENNFFFY